MKEDTKVNAGRRLARVEGQVRALRRMVEEDKYCIDIVRQVQAARADWRVSSLSSSTTTFRPVFITRSLRVEHPIERQKLLNSLM